MTAEATVACANGCWELTMRGEHAEQDDRDFLNHVGVPANVTNRAGGSTTCDNCDAAISVTWADEDQQDETDEVDA